MPRLVGINFLVSRRTYSLSRIVLIVGAYVDGLPIPCSSNALIKLASL